MYTKLHEPTQFTSNKILKCLLGNISTIQRQHQFQQTNLKERGLNAPKKQKHTSTFSISVGVSEKTVCAGTRKQNCGKTNTNKRSDDFNVATMAGYNPNNTNAVDVCKQIGPRRNRACFDRRPVKADFFTELWGKLIGVWIEGEKIALFGRALIIDDYLIRNRKGHRAVCSQQRGV